MKNIPEVIYLQWYDDDGEEAEDITWCVDRINATDIEFRLTLERWRRLALQPLFCLTPLQADAARPEQAEMFDLDAAQLKHGG